MKFYELDEYLVIIHFTDFTERYRCVPNYKLEKFINMLCEDDHVFDFVITRKVDFDPYG